MGNCDSYLRGGILWSGEGIYTGTFSFAGSHYLVYTVQTYAGSARKKSSSHGSKVASQHSVSPFGFKT